MENKNLAAEVFSDWLIEDIDIEKIIKVNSFNLTDNTQLLTNLINDTNNFQRVGIYYARGYDQRVYSRTSSYDRYNVKYYNYYNYSDYSKSYSDYSKYSKYYYNYYNYYNYSVYSLYYNYVCNTCQGLCEINQLVSYWLGYTLVYTDSVTINAIMYARSLNELIDYINAAAVEARLTIDLSQYKVKVGDTFSYIAFNKINEAINSFVDTSTKLANITKGEKITANQLNTFKDTINIAKISSTFSCCQTPGYEQCVSAQRIG